MLRDNRSLLLPAILFALTLSLDVGSAVLNLNRLPYVSLDALWIVLSALTLIGIPAAAGFVIVSRVLARRVANPPAAALALAMAGLLLYGFCAAVLDSAEADSFLRCHLGLACFVVLALLTFLRLSDTRLALFGAFLVGVTVTLATGGRNVSYASVAGELEGLRLRPVPFGGRVLLLGVDGLGWDTLQRWAAAHRSETYEWFRRNSVQAPLETLTPTLSPRIWASIATGVPPEDHGVVAFTSLDYEGLCHSRLVSPRFEGAFYWTNLLEQIGAAQRMPVSSLDLRKPPVWEIVGRPAYPVDVLAWWATWPAQPIPGRMVSDRFYFSRPETDAELHFEDGPAPSTSLPSAAVSSGAPSSSMEAPDGLTFPPALEAELEPLRRAPESMTAEELARFVEVLPGGAELAPDASTETPHDPREEIRYAYTSDETWFDIAMKFLDDAPLNVTMVAYFRGIDMVSHGAMQFSHLYPETQEANRHTASVYSEAVCRYYEYALARVRQLIEKAGENTVVLVVSDHGFEESSHGGFGHYGAPEGVLLAMGGGSPRADSPETCHVYDVAPTVLWLRGYPESEDMPGRALTGLFPNLRPAEPRTLATYGYRLADPAAGPGSAQTDEEMLHLLKTLGYVK